MNREKLIPKLKIAGELLLAFALIVAAIGVVKKVERNYAFLDWRYWLHQKIQTYAARAKRKPLVSRDTILVLIGDSDFWGNEYEGRLPINRKRLGELLIAIAKLKPKVIGVDFNLCSPTMDGTLKENWRFEQESKDFANAVRSVSSPECTVVLPKFLHIISTPEPGYYVGLPNRFDGVDPKLSEVARLGYINLTPDFRIIPRTVVLQDETSVESFSRAIVHAFRPDLSAADSDDDSVEYCGAYLDKFNTFSADEIRRAEQDGRLKELTEEFSGRVVIVGAGWTRYSAADPNDKYTAVDKIDTQDGPVGKIPAVYIHANWVESMLSGRTGAPLNESLRFVIEFVIGLLAFLLFRGWLPWIRKRKRLLFTLRIIFFPLALLFWVLVSYFGFQNFGLFVDPVPGFAGAFLALIDRMVAKIWQWRKDARAFKKHDCRLTTVSTPVAPGGELGGS